MLSHKMRLYHVCPSRPSRFGSLDPTSLRNSRCTFPLRGLAQDYHIFQLRLPLSSRGLYCASVRSTQFPGHDQQCQHCLMCQKQQHLFVKFVSHLKSVLLVLVLQKKHLRLQQQSCLLLMQLVLEQANQRLCYSRFPCGARNKLGFHRDRNSLSPLGEDWTISSLN